MTARTETSFRLGRPLAALALAFLTALPAMAEAPAPDARSRPRRKQMVAAADPRAVEAGLAILRDGGNAIDAAVAVQAMLTLVEPQSSGLGGGAFLLYWDAKTQTLHAFDGRETAPTAIDPRVFLNADGTPRPCARRSSAASPSACPACSRCWPRHRRNSARPHGPRSSKGRSPSQSKASPSRRVSRCCSRPLR